MDENVFVLAEELTKGLRSDRRALRNVKTLSSCYNVRPRPFGLSSIPERVKLFRDMVNWPFPQLFKCSKYNFLADETDLYFVDSAMDKIPVVVYDAYNPDVVSSIIADGAWHVMDFGEFFMFFNGSSVVFHSNIHNVTGDLDKVYTQSAVSVSTGCAFRGRGILAGFDEADFWKPEWQDLWAEWSGVRHDLDPSVGPGENFVWWSSIGGGDLLWLFYPEYAVGGYTNAGYTINRSAMMTLLRRNQIGFIPLPWQGKVLCVKPLGKGVMAYSEGGVAFLHTVADPPSFGLTEIMDIGIKARGAVGGSSSEHVFVDEAGYLYVIDARLKVTRLGYQEFFEGMSSKILVAYDSLKRDTYISDGSKGYVFTGTGLAEVAMKPTSVIQAGGAGYEVSIGNADEGFEIGSDVFDLGDREVATIHSVEVGVTSGVPLFVKVDSRDDKSQLFTEGEWLETSEDGSVRPVVSGVEFKVWLRTPSRVGVEVDYVKVIWSRTCKQDVGALLDV